jgi:hypothetical protein
MQDERLRQSFVRLCSTASRSEAATARRNGAVGFIGWLGGALPVRTLDGLPKTAFVWGECRHSSVGQERLICNQQVVGSNPTAGSSQF